MDRGYEAGSQSEVGVLTGGQDGADSPTGPPGGPDVSTCGQGSAAATAKARVSWGTDGRAAADPRQTSGWPDWARPQLLQAVSIARRARERGEKQHLAATLYRDWFYPSIGRPGELLRAGRPLAGLYRSAHAGSAFQRTTDEYEVLRRHDVIGRDGWWRTWGESWTPPRSRPGSVRLLMTPRPDQLAAVVRTITCALLDSPESWLLACATDPRRLRRTGSVVLDLPSADVLPDATFDSLAALLRPAAPPLCLPVMPGLALAEFPDNGMTFGEHRCHLIALGLRRADAEHHPLRSIAEVFATHGIDAGQPYRLR